MLITENQEKMITKLKYIIEYAWGISIGYYGPWGAVIGENPDFVIIDTTEPKEFMEAVAEGREVETTGEQFLVYKEDLDIQEGGISIFIENPKYPTHDDDVQAFIERIKTGLLEGEIWYPISCETTYETHPLVIEQLTPETYSVSLTTGRCTTSTNTTMEKLKEDCGPKRICDILKSDLKTIIDREFCRSS